MPSWLRSRLPYLLLAASTIAVGLAIHGSGHLLPPSPKDVLGDALWAINVLWCTGVVKPSAPLARRAAVALAIAFAVELSQLYHAPWIDGLRRTTPGRLVLGSGFDPRDLLAYSLGIGAAALAERWAKARSR